MNIDTALAELGKYADQLAESDGLADQDSLPRAITTQRLYESFEWVEEWNGIKPIKPQKYGRPADPKGRNRFAQWLAWRLEQDGHRPIQSVYAYRLIEAARAASSFAHGQIKSERVVRPMTWLTKHGYADRIPEVWAIAVELAGSSDAVTSAHTRQAVNQWKRDVLGGKGVKEAIRTKKAERDRIRAQTQVSQLFADGDQDEVERFHQWYIDFLRERQGQQEQPERKAA